MNEIGKLRHGRRILIFRRGLSRDKDVLVRHVVTRKQRSLKAWRNLQREFEKSWDADFYDAWVVDEIIWREFGMAGRP